MTDAELVTRVLKRDRRALRFLYTTHVPRVARYINVKIQSHADAEEVLQDTLFSFLESLRDYAGKSSVRTFLHAIAHHKVVDYYRKKKIKQVVFSQVAQLESFVSPLLTPEDEMDAGLVREKIRFVLGALLPQYRVVLVYKYLENLSVIEIAQRLKTTVKSVESPLSRARASFIHLYG